MKIVCNNCETRYSLAEERVRGKVFKIRCKKCQNIIVVGGDRPPSEQSGDPTPMKGARHEDSVLFNLSNMHALAVRAKPGDAAPPYSPAGALLAGPGEPEGHGSGLIDIRSMVSVSALATVGDSASAGAISIPDPGSCTSAVAATPVLLPATADQQPRWLVPGLLGVGGTLLLTVIVLGVILTNRKAESQVIAVLPPAPQEEKKVTVPPKLLDRVTEGLAEKTADKIDAPGARINVVRKSAALTPRARSRQGRTRRPRRARSEATHGAAVPLKKSASRIVPRKGEDPLNKLIDEAIGGKQSLERSVKKRAVSAPDPRLPRSIGKTDIQRGMRRITGRVRACYEKFRVPGMATVKVTISSKGRLSSAVVRGRFAATPTGACVRTAVMAARFPAFSGSPISFKYPFMLQPS